MERKKKERRQEKNSRHKRYQDCTVLRIVGVDFLPFLFFFLLLNDIYYPMDRIQPSLSTYSFLLCRHLKSTALVFHKRKPSPYNTHGLRTSRIAVHISMHMRALVVTLYTSSRQTNLSKWRMDNGVIWRCWKITT